MSDLIDRAALRTRVALLREVYLADRNVKDALGGVQVLIDAAPRAATEPPLDREELAFALCLDEGPAVDDPASMHVCDAHRMQAERIVRILAIRAGDKAEAPPQDFGEQIVAESHLGRRIAGGQ